MEDEGKEEKGEREKHTNKLEEEEKTDPDSKVRQGVPITKPDSQPNN